MRDEGILILQKMAKVLIQKGCDVDAIRKSHSTSTNLSLHKCKEADVVGTGIGTTVKKTCQNGLSRFAIWEPSTLEEGHIQV